MVENSQGEARGGEVMAKEKKLCPRRFHPDGDGECIGESCEWWIVGMGGISIATCSIRVLAENLFFIRENLKRVK
ncbi:unnamed protein product [marine sediment metagenome]|uniref:Uncharacterized protein n=1 Tax=marine sediment metagenome TaxID=412755 RepID=X1BVL1_9ZZZZ